MASDSYTAYFYRYADPYDDMEW